MVRQPVPAHWPDTISGNLFYLRGFMSQAASQTFFARRLFTGHQWLSDVLIEVSHSTIARLTPNAAASDAYVLEGIVCPGFIDIQVNGGGGVQFNHTPSTACLMQMASAHATTGTASLMPTVITDDITVMSQAAQQIAAVRQTAPHVFLGVHFEGPHLSAAKKGMHSQAHIRPLSEAEIALFCDPSLGQVIVTLAPEMVTTSQISALTQAGVIVNLGHTDATFEQASEAFAAGARGVTHLYNAMSAMTSRAPGVVGAALYHQHTYAGLIVDHHHVHPASATLAIRAKGAQRMCLVTDAMAPAASDIDHFFYQDTKVVRDKDTLRLDDGTLAGSVLTMIEAVRNTHFDLGFSLTETLQMATSTPAAYLGHQLAGQLAPGSYASFLHLDEQLNLLEHWVGGSKG